MSPRARLLLAIFLLACAGTVAFIEFRRRDASEGAGPAEPSGPPWPAGPDGKRLVPKTLPVNIELMVPWGKTLDILRGARAAGFQAILFPQLRRGGQAWRVWLPEAVPDWKTRTPIRIELDRKGGGETVKTSFRPGAPRAFRNLPEDLEEFRNAEGPLHPVEVLADGELPTGIVLRTIQAALNAGCPEVGLPAP